MIIITALTMVSAIMIKRSTATIPARDFQSESGPIAVEITASFCSIRTRRIVSVYYEHNCADTHTVSFVFAGESESASFRRLVADLCRFALIELRFRRARIQKLSLYFRAYRCRSFCYCSALIAVRPVHPTAEYTRGARGESRVIRPEYLGRLRKGVSFLGMREGGGGRRRVTGRRVLFALFIRPASIAVFIIGRARSRQP